MTRRKTDPAALVVEYFSTASITAAETVLEICRATVARRKAATAPRVTRKKHDAEPSITNHEGIDVARK